MRHLRLSQEQETKLVEFLKKRLLELDGDNRDRIRADETSDLDYRNSKEYRAKIGTVFAESNMPVPLTSYVVDHFAARTEEELFGRDPMAKFEPAGPSDVETARGLDRFASYKLFEQGRVKNDLLESLHTIFRHRAQFTKAIYEEDVDFWEEHEVMILHDGLTQQAVLIIDHGYVIEGRDTWIEMLHPITGFPVQILEADPTVIFDPARHYYAPSPLPIKFRDVVYAGPRSREVDSECIRIPNDARSLNEADAIAEYYDKPSHWIRPRFLKRAWIDWTVYEQRIRAETGSRKTKDKRREQSKDAKAFDLDNSSIGIVEVWLERDVLAWGTPQRIVVWMDRKTDVLIDYEYQKLVTPHGRHPYTATAVAKTESYWWGYSIPEMLKPFQEYIDLQWNRHSFRNSVNANPILGQNPDAIQEKKSFYELRPFDVMTFEPGKTMKDWLEAFVFPNADLDTQDLIDKAVYWVNFWLGISNIARGDYSDVPQNTTLGGQEGALKEASKLSRRWTRRVVTGLEDHLTKLAQILLVTMNPEEAYTYLEGEVKQIGFMAQNAVKNLFVNAKLTVGKDTSTQALQEQQLTLQTIEKYVMYPPQIQLIVRPVMKRILFLLGHDDVEALLPVPMMPAIDPVTGQQVMVPMTPGMAPPPNALPNSEQQIPGTPPTGETPTDDSSAPAPENEASSEPPPVNG